ncbi:restriction endonuclease subunit S [Acinetobacter albensis]|uniref:restriction endonuclease subunit S n=1 Tax=Acinetobacter albensis TaxID=1673609 RepID=UPI00187FE780|nr:restriction endonuclease subunit S [Acinetobacter albensis]MBE9402045.1 restriction endonuclease subunit S [Acinetobacter albensis]
MSYPMIEIGELMLKRNGSVDPSKFVDETFELHSIPAFDRGFPDIVKGSEIGSSKQLVQENDVMISKIVPHIRRASVVCKKGNFRQIASGEWIVFRSDKIYPDYLKHVLISDIFNKQFMSTVSGVGGSLLRARPAFVSKIKIALPPLSEQRRIASILDKVDELRQKRQQAIKKLDQLLQATFIDMFGDPISNPKNWNNCRLEQVTHKITDGTHKTPIYMSSGIEFLSAKDIKNGHIVWDTKKYISEQEHCQLIKRCNPEFGDIVLAKSGSLGSVAVIDRSHQFSLFESLCLIKHDRKKIDALFLTCMLRNPSMLAHLLGKNKGIAIKHLHLVDIRGLQILLPPISLQHEFASRIRAMDKLKSIHSASFESLNSLFKSLQSQAFSGTL